MVSILLLEKRQVRNGSLKRLPKFPLTEVVLPVVIVHHDLQEATSLPIFEFFFMYSCSLCISQATVQRFKESKQHNSGEPLELL